MKWYLNKQNVRELAHSVGKYISSTAMDEINRKVERIVLRAGENAGGKKTIIDLDVIHVK